MSDRYRPRRPDVTPPQPAAPPSPRVTGASGGARGARRGFGEIPVAGVVQPPPPMPIPEVTTGATPETGIDLDYWAQTLASGNQQALQAALAEIQANAAMSRAGVASGLADVGLGQERARHGLETGLRDLEQARVQGLEDATSNALQRGIYDSGIREENQATVQREAAEGESDMRKEFDFTMRGLANRASGLRQQLSALQQVMQAQMASAQVGSDQQWQQLRFMLAQQTPNAVEQGLRDQPTAAPGGGGGGSVSY